VLAVRERVAILPSGSPVLKKKGSANAGLADTIATAIVAIQWASPRRTIGSISDSMLRMVISPVWAGAKMYGFLVQSGTARQKWRQRLDTGANSNC
jgi:hypothetical protein